MRLAVTRNKSQLGDLESRAKARNIELVPLPLTEIEPIQFTWPLEGNPRVDWLVFTSANGVRIFLERIHELNSTIDHDTKIAVVGNKTGEEVVNCGFSVAFVPSNQYGETLFRELREQHLQPGNCLVYVRAEEVVTDPRADMTASGVDYREIICYRSVPLASDRGIIANLESHDRILFTAPSKVSAYHAQFGIPQAQVIAIGNTTAGEMRKLGWQNIVILSTADIDCIWEQL